MRTLYVLVPLLFVLALAVVFAWIAWTGIDAPPMPLTGHIAMWLGIVLSLAVGIGLMTLLFFSARRGYDERAARSDRMRDGWRDDQWRGE